MLKVWGSLYSLNLPVFESIQILESIGVDGIHFDCIDDENVLVEAKTLRGHSALPFELHTVGANQVAHLAQAAESGFERVLLQAEGLSEGFRWPATPANLKIGVAVLSGTFEPYLDLLDRADYVCVMASIPGVSGAPFSSNAFEQIKALRSVFPEKPLMVDGGVTEEIRDDIRSLGVDEVVVGSRFRDLEKNAVIRASISAGQGVLSLISSSVMRPLWATPYVREGVSLLRVLEQMNNGHLGYIAVTSGSNKLEGIISDGDIRRAVALQLGGGEPFLDVESVINRSPLVLGQNQTLGELFQQLGRKGFPKINNVMVVDDSGSLLGHIPEDVLRLL
jgi:arabinose-5-phosphate isomerase